MVFQIITVPKIETKFGNISIKLTDITPSNRTLNFALTQENGPTQLEFLQTNETVFDVRKVKTGTYLLKLDVKEEYNDSFVTTQEYLENVTVKQETESKKKTQTI